MTIIVVTAKPTRRIRNPCGTSPWLAVVVVQVACTMTKAAVGERCEEEGDEDVAHDGARPPWPARSKRIASMASTRMCLPRDEDGRSPPK